MSAFSSSFLNCCVTRSTEEEEVYVSDSEDDLEQVPLLQAVEQPPSQRERAPRTISDEQAQELRSQLLRILELYESERQRRTAQNGDGTSNDNTTNIPATRGRRVVSISISNILSNGR